MTALADILDPSNLAHMVEERMIAAKEGPDGLTLYDYTQAAQFSGTWNRETTTCRGLIARADGTVQARPFAKFFNVSEHDRPDLPDLPALPFEVYEKVDGSLIIASRNEDGSTLLTTRGSFNSEQAVAARAIWPEGLTVPEGETWLFEFIAPWNRIVVDYGGETKLVMLAALDIATGTDLAVPHEWPGEYAHRFDGLTDLDAIAEALADLGSNDEGFVLRFEDGTRAKAKGAEYLRLHKLITGCTARTIWECLSNGTSLEPLLERVPDEFHKWVTVTQEDLLAKHHEVVQQAVHAWSRVRDLPTRKDQALALVDDPHKALAFALLDGKDIGSVVWRGLRPEHERPYFVEDVAS